MIKHYYKEMRLPKGKYLVRIMNIDNGYNRGGFGRRVLFRFKVIDGPLAGKRSTMIFMLVNEKGVDRLRNELMSLGIWLPHEDHFKEIEHKLLDKYIWVEQLNQRGKASYSILRWAKKPEDELSLFPVGIGS